MNCSIINCDKYATNVVVRIIKNKQELDGNITEKEEDKSFGYCKHHWQHVKGYYNGEEIKKINK